MFVNTGHDIVLTDANNSTSIAITGIKLALLIMRLTCRSDKDSSALSKFILLTFSPFGAPPPLL